MDWGFSFEKHCFGPSVVDFVPGSYFLPSSIGGMICCTSSLQRLYICPCSNKVTTLKHKLPGEDKRASNVLWRSHTMQPLLCYTSEYREHDLLWQPRADID